MDTSETSLSLPVVDVSEVECVCVWVVHIVVDTSSLLVSCWLPELSLPVGVMVEVKNVLRCNSDDIQASEVGLVARIEAAEVREVVKVSFILVDLNESVKAILVRIYTVWKRSHGVHSSSNSIEWHTDSHGGSNSDSS